MSTRFLSAVSVAALLVCSTLAYADTPTRVGRIAMSQGEVGISGEQGEETSAALVNWPVTSRNQITTGRDGRTEIRIGSTAVRLDADSALDVTELEDDSLRLHLHYGSASIRVRNGDLARGFDLSTPQGTIRLQEPGQIRVDAGRSRDTTVVSVFSGVAQIDGGGSRLTVRAGKRAEIGQDDVRTGLAMRDNFDEWSLQRDLRDERSESVRYVSSEMTGYEDLDRNGNWREDAEYGPLWSPRDVPFGWAPYRDGRWTYLQPWGWTWVDNAPWGYAPFHYGRWVMVNQRWCWAPGRNVSRAIWSPALVGWVGGNNWNANFGSGHARRVAPATGWYPLTPRDTYTPSYRMKHDNLRYLNRNAGSAQPDVRGRTPYRRNDAQHAGLTVVPHDQFRQRGTVVVPTAPRGTVSPAQLFTGGAVAGVPSAPQFTGRGRDWRRVEQRDGQGPDGARNLPRSGFQQQQQPAVSTDDQRRGNGLAGMMRRSVEAASSPAPVMVQSAPQPATIISLPSQPMAQGDAQTTAREERNSRFKRADVERDPDVERGRRARGAESFQQQQAQQQNQQQMQQQQAQQQQIRMQQQQAQQQIIQQQRMQQQQIRAQQMQQAQAQQQQAQAQAQQQQAQAQQQQAQAQQQQAQQQQAQQQQAQQMQQMQQAQQSRSVQQAAPEPRAPRENAGAARERTQRAREDAGMQR